MATWRTVQIMILLYSISPSYYYCVEGGSLVPCMNIFGDSLVDSGNNNFRATTAKADYYPYGIDFPAGPTGRITNGRTTADVISQLLGFDNYIQPYATVIGLQILNGVNFASAGAGIRDQTFSSLGDIIPFNEQINNYKSIFSRVSFQLGGDKGAEDHLNKCINYFNIGNNDLLGDYFSAFTNTRKQYTIDQYIDVLIQQFAGQLFTLYGYGARKFVINGLGQGGCIPYDLALYNKDRCPKGFDDPLVQYNRKLKKLIDNLNNVTEAKFILTDGRGIFNELLDNPSAHGIKVINAACCGAGRNNAERLCPRFQTPCPNRTEFAFWDSYHPTEIANIYVANREFHSQKPTDAFPFDIFHLARL